MALTPAELTRYGRHLAIPEIGIAGQEKLKCARVLIVGAGGLGAPVALYLVASGVGVVGLVDDDRVELSNLQRQVLYPVETLGRSKAEAARVELMARNPDVEIVAHVERLTAQNAADIIGRYDIVVDGTDRFSARYLINDACVLIGKALVTAAIHRFEGQALTYVPGRGPCYRCLFAEPPGAGLVPNCAEAGVLGVLPGVMGTLQATEVVKLITGIGEPLCGRLLTYDALAMRFDEFRFDARPDCAVCGERPTIKTMAQAGLQRPANEAEVVRLSPAELNGLMRESGRLTIVDVREPHEFAANHLRGSINAPLSRLAEERGALMGEGMVVFVCRSGARSESASAQATQWIAKERVAHLEGGLLAWAREIDQSFDVPPV